MLPYLVSAIGFVVAFMLQYGVVSRTTMLSGAADLILLFVAAWSLHEHNKRMWILVLLFASFVGFVSATPFFVPILVYLGIFLLSKILNIWVWRTPLLAMFLLTFVGTLFQHVLYLIVLWVTETPFDWGQAFANVTLPSILLNMLLAIPVHALVQEMARSVYPAGLET
ncbi:MAG: hypothetical protein WBI14_09140 [Anaerolineaceae bacterium]